MTNKRSINAQAKKLGAVAVFNADNVRIHTPTITIAFGGGMDENCEDENGEYDAGNAAVAALEAVEFWVGGLTEHPGIEISRDPGEDFIASKDGVEVARDPDMEDLLQTLSEGVEEEEAEDEGRGSVVPDKFKKLYAEQSPDRKVDCGDWLADQMASFCIVPVVEGKKKTMTDLDRFESICVANGVDAKKMDALRADRPGWQGRFRMTGRNLLTPLVAAKGVLFVPEGFNAKGDLELKAPREWCVENAPKPKAEKKAKKAAAVEAAPGKGKAPKAEKKAKPAKAPKAKKGA